MDGKAYLTEEIWQALLDIGGKNSVSLRDKRYDLVLHLITAANGALHYYDFENNPARHEVGVLLFTSKSPDFAVELDRWTQACWIGHNEF
jgi:hypothetical protein